MHKGLYWSQLITGIGIGLIIAALVWIYVPQFYPGLEPALNRIAGIEETNEAAPVADSESPDSTLLEVNYSHLLEEPEETELADGNKNLEQAEPDEPQQQAQVDPQLTDDTAASTEVAMVENEPSLNPTGDVGLPVIDPIEDLTGEESSLLNPPTVGEAQDADQTQSSEVESTQQELSTTEVAEQPETGTEQVTEPVDTQMPGSDPETTDLKQEPQDQPTSTEVDQKDDLQQSTDEKNPVAEPQVADAEQTIVEPEVQKVTVVPKKPAGFTTPEAPAGPKVVTLADLKVFEVEIEYGDTAKDVAKKLEQFGLAHRKDFLKLISLQNLERKLKVGRYYIKNGTSLVDLIDELTSY